MTKEMFSSLKRIYQNSLLFKYITFLKRGQDMKIGGITMRNFESIFILKPDVTEDQVTNILNDIKKFIDVRKEEKWGKRKLAYSIQKYNEGYYVLIEFEKPNNNHEKLEEYYKNNELIIKHIIVARD